MFFQPPPHTGHECHHGEASHQIGRPSTGDSLSRLFMNNNTLLLLTTAIIFLMVGAVLDQCRGRDLPDKSLTPGAANPALTQSLVCSRNFRTGLYRHVTPAMHRAVFKNYGLSRCFATPSCRRGYEDDHLISIELGGSNENSNRWPQSYSGVWNARKKDALETHLHHLVCRGVLTQAQAQREISRNWIKSYKKRRYQIKQALHLRLYRIKDPE